MSSKDKENFKGGPMPESARVEMMKRMAAANAQAQVPKQGDASKPAEAPKPKQ